MSRSRSIFNPVITGKSKPSAETPTMVLLSGFPDRQDSWSRLTPHFEKDYHVIALCLPDFDRDDCNQNHYWGYDHAEILDGLHGIINPIVEALESKVILVGHDWGSYIVQCYATRYPRHTDKLILLDVGAFPDLIAFSIPMWISILQISYMSFLAIVFVVSRLLSKKFATFIIQLYPWSLIGPVPYETITPIELKSAQSHTCYPYFHFFQMYLRSMLPLPKRNTLDSIPQLYCFGSRKLWMFHSNEYLDRLTLSKISTWYEFTESGHWLHWTHPVELSRVMKSFLGSVK